MSRPEIIAALRLLDYASDSLRSGDNEASIGHLIHACEKLLQIVEGENRCDECGGVGVHSFNCESQEAE